VPLLLLDSNVDDLPIDSVTTDGFSAGKMVVDYLYERGHRQMLMLAYDLEDYNIDLRSRGFHAGLKDRGLPVADSLIRTFVDNDEGLPLLLERLRSASPPTAVVCVNDTLASFMVQRVREAGFRVPDDVSFVGYDDDLYARTSIPALTTVAVNKAELGKTGAEMILRRLREPASPIGKIRLPVNMVARDSVADRRAGPSLGLS
jgi:LacI family transcriptional regulator